MCWFIHLGSRKVFVTPSTFNPTGDWMRQQARNVSLWAHEETIDIRFLIHDRDTKFTNAFDGYFRKVIKTPYLAPKANSFAESWIGHFKRECLNHFLCFGLGQRDHLAGASADYYNRYRPHQGLGNRPLGSVSDPPGTEGAKPDRQTIRCHQWLGGLLKHYYRKAA